MKKTAVAPSNIAFIKYWGKADEALRIPANSSISMNLSGAYTTTTVDFSTAYTKDEVSYIDTSDMDKLTRQREFGYEERKRVIEQLDRIRKSAHINTCAKVMTQNTFPKGTGIASSASGFAALTVAGFAAAEASLNEKELTIFARMGSGSACRSIPDGYVFWEKGDSSDTSYAYSLYPHGYWDLRDIVCVVDLKEKKVSTTEGHQRVETSPLWGWRHRSVDGRIEAMKRALAEKNFTSLGGLIEEDCLEMHHVMQTQAPPLYYWNETTVVLMENATSWRNRGLPVYFTIDAGPNVHLICEEKSEKHVLEQVKTISGIESVIVNKPSAGAHLVESHLY